jgi:hypothetical protein
MKHREFNKLLERLSITVDGDGKKKKSKLLSTELILKETPEVLNSIIDYLVRARAPIVKEFINKETDITWLHSMGYLYEKKGKLFTFLCTSEQTWKIK